MKPLARALVALALILVPLALMAANTQVSSGAWLAPGKTGAVYGRSDGNIIGHFWLRGFSGAAGRGPPFRPFR